jgi:putative methionine-R-sulfoxide reductase with GAF domain
MVIVLRMSVICMSPPLLAHQLLAIAQSSRSRRERAQEIVVAIRNDANYRWVGLFLVDGEHLSLFAHTGESAPITSQLRLGEGLNGAAALTRESIIVNDVTQDVRYQPTYPNTKAELAVPVTDPVSDRVVATLSVESDQLGAFGPTEVVTLEVCGWAMAPLWED